MRSYSYFPGCSSSAGAAIAYAESIRAVSGALGIRLIELEDWNCCGSTPYLSTNELGSLCVAARNLALAKKTGKDLVTPCSSCNIILRRVNTRFREYPELRRNVQKCLAEAGLDYSGEVRVRHLFEVLKTDIGFDNIAKKVVNPLTGLKVAAYYGCQLIRPDASFDNPDNLASLESLITTLGAQAVDFPLRDRCCGGLLIVPEHDLALSLMKKVLDSADKGGAQCIVTVCPLCQTNLDAFQSMVNKRFKTAYNLPVLFFTQLIGLALGISPKALALNKAIIPVDKLIKPYIREAVPVAKGVAVG